MTSKTNKSASSKSSNPSNKSSSKHEKRTASSAHSTSSPNTRMQVEAKKSGGNSQSEKALQKDRKNAGDEVRNEQGRMGRDVKGMQDNYENIDNDMEAGRQSGINSDYYEDYGTDPSMKFQDEPEYEDEDETELEEWNNRKRKDREAEDRRYSTSERGNKRRHFDEEIMDEDDQYERSFNTKNITDEYDDYENEPLETEEKDGNKNNYDNMNHPKHRNSGKQGGHAPHSGKNHH